MELISSVTMKKHVLICGLGILLGFLLNTGVLAAANSSIGRWTIWSKNPALQWEDAFSDRQWEDWQFDSGTSAEERSLVFMKNCLSADGAGIK